MISTRRKAAHQLRLDIHLAWKYLLNPDEAELIAALLFTTTHALAQRLALGGNPGQTAARQIIAAHKAIETLYGPDPRPDLDSRH